LLTGVNGFSVVVGPLVPLDSPDPDAAFSMTTTPFFPELKEFFFYQTNPQSMENTISILMAAFFFWRWGS
jgi:hypothetical protein